MKKEKKKFVVLLIILIIIIVILFGSIYLCGLNHYDYEVIDGEEIHIFNDKFVDYSGEGRSAAYVKAITALINASNAIEEESGRGWYVTLTDGTGEDYVHTDITERVYKDDYEFATEEDEEYTVTLYYSDGAVIEVEITK